MFAAEGAGTNLDGGIRWEGDLEGGKGQGLPRERSEIHTPPSGRPASSTSRLFLPLRAMHSGVHSLSEHLLCAASTSVTSTQLTEGSLGPSCTLQAAVLVRSCLPRILLRGTEGHFLLKRRSLPGGREQELRPWQLPSLPPSQLLVSSQSLGENWGPQLVRPLVLS